MEKNTAAPADDLIERLALHHIAPGFRQLAAISGKGDYRKTEQFARVKAYSTALLASHPAPQAAAEGVVLSDELAISAAMKAGNKHGVKSFDALRIVAAYVAATERPAIPAQGQSELPPLPEPEVLYQADREDITGYTADQMHAYGRAAQEQAASCPDGWKLVPIKLTEAMTDALQAIDVTDAWNGALEVAPIPPAVPQPRELTDAEIDSLWSEVLLTQPLPQPAYRELVRRAMSTPPAQKA